MVCEKMLFLFLLGTFVTVLFCHFPFDCTFSGYSTQWSVGIEGLEVWNVSVGGARGPAGCLDWWETFLSHLPHCGNGRLEAWTMIMGDVG